MGDKNTVWCGVPGQLSDIDWFLTFNQGTFQINVMNFDYVFSDWDADIIQFINFKTGYKELDFDVARF